MFCGKCGQRLTGQERYCPKCGTLVETETEEKFQPREKNKKKHSVYKVMGSLFLSVVCMVILVVAYREIRMTINQLLPYTENGKWGYISSKTGKVEVEAIYDNVTAFKGTEALVNKGGEWILINGLGEEKESLGEFDEAKQYSKGIYVVTKDGYQGIVDRKGKFIEPIHCDSIGVNAVDNYVLYICTIENEDQKQDYLFRGETRLYEQYSDINLLSTGHNQFFLLREDGKTGVGSGNEKIIVPCVYDVIYPYQLDNDVYFAGMLKNENAQEASESYKVENCYDETGKMCGIPAVLTACNVLMNDGAQITSDIFPIYENGKVGYADAEGNIVISPQFIGGVGFWNSECTLAETEDSEVIIDKSGNIIFELDNGWTVDSYGFWNVTNMEAKGWMIAVNDGSYEKMVIDSDGEILIKNTDIVDFGNNEYVFIHNAEGKAGLYNARYGFIEVDCEWTDAALIPGTDWVYFYDYDSEEGVIEPKYYFNMGSREGVHVEC